MDGRNSGLRCQNCRINGLGQICILFCWYGTSFVDRTHARSLYEGVEIHKIRDYIGVASISPKMRKARAPLLWDVFGAAEAKEYFDDRTDSDVVQHDPNEMAIKVRTGKADLLFF
jgi:hypothetical protein